MSARRTKYLRTRPTSLTATRVALRCLANCLQHFAQLSCAHLLKPKCVSQVIRRLRSDALVWRSKFQVRRAGMGPRSWCLCWPGIPDHSHVDVRKFFAEVRPVLFFPPWQPLLHITLPLENFAQLANLRVCVRAQPGKGRPTRKHFFCNASRRGSFDTVAP